MIKNAKYFERWNGVYKGVSWEIVKDYSMDKPWFCMYVYLAKNKMIDSDWLYFNLKAKKDDKGREYYNYNKLSFDIGSGITYYQKERKDLIKIGCDYNHSWDQDRDYDELDIYRDVKKCIEGNSIFSRYKMWCHNCGKITEKENGIIGDEESRYLFKCKDCK